MIQSQIQRILQFVGTITGVPEIASLLNRLGLYINNHNQDKAINVDYWDHRSLGKAYVSDRTWLSFVHPDDQKKVELKRQDFIEGKKNFSKDVFRVLDKNQKWRWFSNRIGVVLRNSDGTPWITIGVSEDVSRIKIAEEEASQRAREAGTLSATIEVITSSLNLNETVHRVLKQARRLVPYDRATVQVLHGSFLEVLGSMGFSDLPEQKKIRFPYPDEGSLSTRAIQERRPWLSNNIVEDFPKYSKMKNNESIQSWIGVPLIAHGDVVGLITFDSMQTNFYNARHQEMAQAFAGPVAIALENARMHEETYNLAMQDALTGIGSRYAFDLNSRFLFGKAKRECREMALAMLDLDRFKEVNDDFGHQAGDTVLQAVCRTCEEGLRSTDLIARYGGEEIIVLFPDTEVNFAAEIMERIRKKVSELTFKGVDRPVTVSAGISGCVPDYNATLSGIIQRADEALYRAKATGRNRIAVHSI